MSKSKEIWFGIDESTCVELLTEAFNYSYSGVVCSYEQLDILRRVPLPQRIKIVLLVTSQEQAAAAIDDQVIGHKIGYILCDRLELMTSLRSQDRPVGFSVDIDDRASLDFTVANASLADIVVIRFKDPTNIPLELVLATTQKEKTRIFKCVRTVEDGEVSMLTMEHGSDGIVLFTHDAESVRLLSHCFDRATQGAFELKSAAVTRIKHAGMGERVCIDTSSELKPDEGMILGSFSSGGIMVCSETHYLPYMNLRPFRVNAGGLHMYAWGPDKFVPYLSDLRAGDELYVVNSAGNARKVTVARLKIERRPLLLIEAEIEGIKVNAFIQDDWHVRVFGSKGEICPSSEVKVGSQLLGYLDTPGRHVGIPISETIKEV